MAKCTDKIDNWSAWEKALASGKCVEELLGLTQSAQSQHQVDSQSISGTQANYSQEPIPLQERLKSSSIISESTLSLVYPIKSIHQFVGSKSNINEPNMDTEDLAISPPWMNLAQTFKPYFIADSQTDNNANTRSSIDNTSKCGS